MFVVIISSICSLCLLWHHGCKCLVIVICVVYDKVVEYNLNIFEVNGQDDRYRSTTSLGNTIKNNLETFQNVAAAQRIYILLKHLLIIIYFLHCGNDLSIYYLFI